MEYKQILRFPTSCCALAQLSIQDDHPIEYIEREVNKIKKETEKKWNPNNRDGGERAIFVITSPWEIDLEKNLTELGFEKIYEFSRRNGYPKGILKMWIISW